MEGVESGEWKVDIREWRLEIRSLTYVATYTSYARDPSVAKTALSQGDTFFYSQRRGERVNRRRRGFFGG